MNLIRLATVPSLILACALLAGCGGQSKEEIETRDNMHALHTAFMNYREDKGERWPETLEELRPYVEDFDALMTNPITGDNPGYQYFPPDNTGAEESDENEGEGEENAQVVIVQLRNGKPDNTLRKLYSDGWVGHE